MLLKFYWDFQLYLREVNPTKANKWVHAHVEDRDEHQNEQSVQHLYNKEKKNNTGSITQCSITMSSKS